MVTTCTTGAGYCMMMLFADVFLAALLQVQTLQTSLVHILACYSTAQHKSLFFNSVSRPVSLVESISSLLPWNLPRGACRRHILQVDCRQVCNRLVLRRFRQTRFALFAFAGSCDETATTMAGLFTRMVLRASFSRPPGTFSQQRLHSSKSPRGIRRADGRRSDRAHCRLREFALWAWRHGLEFEPSLTICRAIESLLAAFAQTGHGLVAAEAKTWL